MKKENLGSVKALKKQLGAAVAMVCVAAVALGSSTYAWFVSNNKVKATTSKISAQSNAPFLNIDADYDDQSSLLWKFVTDIKDTLFDDKPIDAAGNEAPNDSYYSDRVITWENRRNQ